MEQKKFRLGTRKNFFPHEVSGAEVALDVAIGGFLIAGPALSRKLNLGFWRPF